MNDDKPDLPAPPAEPTAKPPWATVWSPEPSPAPPFDEANVPCLQGPCRHYHEVWTHFEHGNAPGTLAREPRQRAASCMRHPGVEMELSADSPILACNQWEPTPESELKSLERLRESYRRRKGRTA